MINLKSCISRPDVRLWLANQLFIVIFLGLVFGIGFARDWWAPSGQCHSKCRANNAQRFLPEPKRIGGDPGVKYRDNGNSSDAYWYYWQTRPEDRTWWGSHLLPWLGYIIHNALVWWFMYEAQREHLGKPVKYTTSLRSCNWKIFITNTGMYLLHLGQTHWTYDGTAVDVVITSGLGSVTTMIAFILALEFKDRGIVFGWPAREDQDKGSLFCRKISGQVSYIIRKYHGYMFVWFNVWTFWYHPLENTPGHAAGMWLIWQFLTQSSLMYTKMHRFQPWRVFVEVAVVFHGPVMTIQKYLTDPDRDSGEPSQWPMFLFGFLFAFFFTSIFTIDAVRKLRWYFRPIPWILYFIFAAVFFEHILGEKGSTWQSGLAIIIRVPAILYLTALLGCVTIGVTNRLTRSWRDKINPWWWMLAAFSMVLFFTAISILVQLLEWTKKFSFPLLNNAIWLPVNGIIAGLFLVFLDNHFKGLPRPSKVIHTEMDNKAYVETTNTL